MKHFFRYLKRGLIILFFPLFIYLVLLTVGGLIPINTGEIPNGSIKVYLVQSGSHTDIIVPIENEIFNWRLIIPSEHFSSSLKEAKYYSFGWGDREFFRKTPYWKDLTVNTAFNALFLNTPSAVHVTRLQEIDNKKIINLHLNQAQYKKMVEYFLLHLEFDEVNGLQPLNFNYSDNDVFYPSKSSFHAFRTCNTWINNALKFSGLRSCLWTSLAYPIFWHYP